MTLCLVIVALWQPKGNWFLETRERGSNCNNQGLSKSCINDSFCLASPDNLSRYSGQGQPLSNGSNILTLGYDLVIYKSHIPDPFKVTKQRKKKKLLLMNFKGWFLCWTTFFANLEYTQSLCHRVDHTCESEQIFTFLSIVPKLNNIVLCLYRTVP